MEQAGAGMRTVTTNSDDVKRAGSALIRRIRIFFRPAFFLQVLITRKKRGHAISLSS
jgi:hypothetical protein